LVLEYVKYGSLRNLLNKLHEYLPITFKIQILKDIAKGLNEIHSKGLIHQDIHPGNILNIDFDQTKITDFGLSKYINKQSDNNEERKPYGSLPYMAPEILRGKPYTQKADIYAFGVIINEVFTGKRPYNIFDDELNLIIDICKNNLRPNIPKNTPEFLVSLLNECWDAEPLNRPTTDDII
ncbi:kinase-like domain-containing protein, partial [Glomus cerebriforme]